MALLGELLAAAGLPHALIGGHAVNAWAALRATDDYDLCVAANREAIERFEGLLVEHDLLALSRMDEGTPSGPEFVRMANASRTVAVDLQTAKTDFQDSVIERSVPTTIGLNVATPEDLIVFKLLAMRGKDQRAIEVLLEWNGLNWEYIERWAEKWGVTDRLARIRSG